jgi:hypothetical protein
MFNEQLSAADSGIEGSLTFWGPEEDDVKFYLAYFGDLSSFKKEGMTFVTRKKNKNTICVCYGDEDKMNCKSCKDLSLPVELKVGGTDKFAPWIQNPVKQLKINKTGDMYLFSMN